MSHTFQVGDTVAYVEGGRGWTAEVQHVDGDLLTVRTVGRNGDYSEPHTLAVADVGRIVAIVQHQQKLEN